MKKVLISSLFVLSMITIVACVNEDDTTNSEPVEEPVTANTEENTDDEEIEEVDEPEDVEEEIEEDPSEGELYTKSAAELLSEVENAFNTHLDALNDPLNNKDEVKEFVTKSKDIQERLLAESPESNYDDLRNSLVGLQNTLEMATDHVDWFLDSEDTDEYSIAVSNFESLGTHIDNVDSEIEKVK